MRSQLVIYIERKMRSKYSYYWLYIFFPSGYWHHKKRWGSWTKTVDKWQHKHDFPKWKEAIQIKLNLLTKWEVFGPIIQMLENVKLVGYKWVFIQKCNKKNKIIRYKMRLVAQDFLYRLGIDYEETYFPVMDPITF